MHTYLWKIPHGHHYFRNRIPNRNSTYLNGQAELRRSLKTTDRTAAKRRRRARVFMLKLDQCFNRIDDMNYCLAGLLPTV